MFYRFNAHRAKKPQIQDSSTDKLAKKIAGKINAVQQGWATFMDKHARRIPAQRLKVILLVLALGSGLYCTYLISGGGLSEVRTRLADFRFEKLWPFDPWAYKEKLKRAAAWDHYLDSLEQQVTLDSLSTPQ